MLNERKTLLRFDDLEQYGVRNWPTLKRWIDTQGFPTGFYLGENTRAWRKEDCDHWLANRPPASKRPGPLGATKETGPKLNSSGTTENSQAAAQTQGGAHG
jgi:predicted DNA-binding transcriptional regulator AlpA